VGMIQPGRGQRTMKTSIGFFLMVVLLFALSAQFHLDEPLKLTQSTTLPGLYDGSAEDLHVSYGMIRQAICQTKRSALLLANGPLLAKPEFAPKRFGRGAPGIGPHS